MQSSAVRTSLFCAAAFLAGLGTASGAFLPDGSFSDDARGLTSAPFLKNPPSARFEGLAGACLTQGGPQAFFCNPAGLAYAPEGLGEVSAAYESLLEGSYRAGASAVRGTRYGAFAAGLLYNNSSSGMERADPAGELLGGFSAYDSAAGLAFARRYGLTDFGFAVKIISSKLAEASGASAALDAGFVFREPGHAKNEFSLAVRNFGFPLKLGSERAPLPLELGGGLKWKYTPDFNLMLEGRMPCDHSPYLITAAEWFLSLGQPPSPGHEVSGLFLRGGMNFRNYSDLGAFGAFAGGFGLRLGALELDYAFVPYGDLGVTHRTGISWRFSGVKPPAEGPEKRSAGRGALVVVAPFENGADVTGTQAEVFRNLFEAELELNGAFRIIARQKLEFILAEKKISYSGFFEDKAAAGLGREVGAQFAVFGSIAKKAEEYLVKASLLEVSSGEVLRSAEAVSAEEYFFRQAARSLVSGLSR